MAIADSSMSVLTTLHYDAERVLLILAHELRGPLSPIRYAAASLSLQNAIGTPTRNAADMIERQVISIEALLDSALGAARRHRHPVPLVRARIDLGATVAGIAEAAAAYVAERGHALKCEYPTLPIYVDADAGELGQIVRNLLTNAAKYTDRGGHISIRVSADAEAAQIRVHDDGMGLAPAQLEAIFDLYAQADQAGSARSAGGLGIGLYVARQLAENHGGSIVATSRGVDRGSEFVVTLPLSAAPVGAAAHREHFQDLGSAASGHQAIP